MGRFIGSVGMMIKKIPGNKGPGDEIILWNGKQVTYLELAQVVYELCMNEDKLYPPSKGFKGGMMLIDLLKEVYLNHGISDYIRRKYKLV